MMMDCDRDPSRGPAAAPAVHVAEKLVRLGAMTQTIGTPVTVTPLRQLEIDADDHHDAQNMIGSV